MIIEELIFDNIKFQVALFSLYEKLRLMKDEIFN